MAKTKEVFGCVDMRCPNCFKPVRGTVAIVHTDLGFWRDISECPNPRCGVRLRVGAGTNYYGKTEYYFEEA